MRSLTTIVLVSLTLILVAACGGSSEGGPGSSGVSNAGPGAPGPSPEGSSAGDCTLAEINITLADLPDYLLYTDEHQDHDVGKQVRIDNQRQGVLAHSFVSYGGEAPGTVEFEVEGKLFFLEEPVSNINLITNWSLDSKDKVINARNVGEESALYIETDSTEFDEDFFHTSQGNWHLVVHIYQEPAGVGPFPTEFLTELAETVLSRLEQCDKIDMGPEQVSACHSSSIVYDPSFLDGVTSEVDYSLGSEWTSSQIEDRAGTFVLGIGLVTQPEGLDIERQFVNGGGEHRISLPVAVDKIAGVVNEFDEGNNVTGPITDYWFMIEEDGVIVSFRLKTSGSVFNQDHLAGVVERIVEKIHACPQIET